MKKKRFLHWATILLSIVGAILLVFILFFLSRNDTTLFQEKSSLLKEYALADWVRLEAGNTPAGEAGNVIFLSVCDGTKRAKVYSGTGQTLEEAWDAALNKADSALQRRKVYPRWVKADVVYFSELISAEELLQATRSSQKEAFRYGIAFDNTFNTALLEAELNGVKIYNYEDGGINLDVLNRYLEKNKQNPINALPKTYTLFQCASWLCDEDNTVYELNGNDLDYGRRRLDFSAPDGAYAKDLILNASGFLANQIEDDGSFLYGIYPRFNEEIDGYNMAGHAGALWSLIDCYSLHSNSESAKRITQGIDFMLDQVVYDSNGNAYLYEKESDEIKLGAGSLAVIALTEYMEAFQDNKYQDVCCALGNGILSLLDQSGGQYYHVLNGDFTPKEAFRSIYYDGEATFALCRLYGLTGEQIWLDAAKSAVQHFIEADYTRCKDHWVAYSMNEITKYVTNNADYYAFALKNVQKNLQEIKECDTTSPTDLELLMATFELYDRMIANGGSTSGFDLDEFLNTISRRAERQLNGYFYPEYAMYTANPQRVLNTFMIREDGFRVRIDDVQHNIGGYYLYYLNYDKLIEHGM